MSFTFNTSNSIGKVRAIIGDVNETSAVLSDEQIQVYLDLQGGDILMSAAMAMRAMASSKALVAKYRSAGNYTEDTRQIASSLLAVAKDLEEAAMSIPADAQAEIIYNDFSFRSIVQNRILRNEPLD